MSTQGYLIAEELDIDPHSVTLDPGRPHPACFNGSIIAETLPSPGYEDGFVAETLGDLMVMAGKLSGAQFTGGSSSTADLHEKLRAGGAVARETLKKAASLREGVAVGRLRMENGCVVMPDRHRIPCTDVAEDAARVSPVTNVGLRPSSQWKWLRRPYLRTDIVSKTTGEHIYGIDLRIDNMLHATMRRNPGIGGEVVSFDARA